MLSALLIVFREVIEAGLIVGIVLAAARACRALADVTRGGMPAACWAPAWSPRSPASWRRCSEGSGQELFNAAILLVAVAMLTWHNVWMASARPGDGAANCATAGACVSAGKAALAALAIVVGIAVLREGSARSCCSCTASLAQRRHDQCRAWRSAARSGCARRARWCRR
jgi:high-affinity iron transporter